MPRLDTWAWSIWALSTLLETALPFCALKSHGHRRFPAVFVFCAFQALKDIFLMGIALAPASNRNAAVFFYVFWAAAAVLCGLRVWIVTELVASSCPVDTRSRRWLQALIPAVAVVCAAIVAASVLHEPATYASAIMRGTVAFGRIVALGWIATFLFAAWCGDFIGIRWSGAEQWVAVGLGIQATAESVMSWILGRFPLIHLFSNLQDSMYVISLLVWIYALTKDEQRLGECRSIEHLREIAEPYIELGNSLREQQ